MSSRPVLLLVDDDASVRRVIRDMLRRIGYAVREAADASEALDALVPRLPAAIVLDVVLPGLSGLDMLDSLRASGIAGGVPVIAITGTALPDKIIRDKGARRILRKPFTLRELRETVEAVLRPNLVV